MDAEVFMYCVLGGGFAALLFAGAIFVGVGAYKLAKGAL